MGQEVRLGDIVVVHNSKFYIGLVTSMTDDNMSVTYANPSRRSSGIVSLLRGS